MKIIDFGVSKDTSSEVKTILIGNSTYRPPEHEKDKACKKGDIWSIAALVLNLLSPVDIELKDYNVNESILHKMVQTVLPDPKDEIFQ